MFRSLKEALRGQRFASDDKVKDTDGAYLPLIRTDYFLQTRSEDLCPATQFALKRGVIVLSNDIIFICHILFYTKQLKIHFTF
jgi:hypothetical protein